MSASAGGVWVPAWKRKKNKAEAEAAALAERADGQTDKDDDKGDVDGRPSKDDNVNDLPKPDVELAKQREVSR